MKRMKFCAALLTVAGCLMSLVPDAHAAPGDLDTTFSGDGKATISLGPGRAVAALGNKTYVLSGDTTMYVTRYLDNGTVDTTFGTAGTTTITFGTTGDYVVPAALAVQLDGDVYVGGTAVGPSYPGGDFALARLTIDGAFDTTFSGDGKNTYGFTSTSSDTLSSIGTTLIVGDGKLVAGGYSNGDGAVLRVNNNGALDPLFSSDGKVTTDLGAPGNVAGYTGLSVGYQGRITAVGTWGFDFVAVRYLSNGSLDTDFNTDGIATVDVTGAGSSDIAQAVTLDLDDNVIVAGSTTYWTGSAYKTAFAVVCLSEYGSLYTPFGGTGKVVTNFSATDDNGARSVKRDSNGKFVVAGFKGGDFAIVRYNANGTLDTTFSGDGKVAVSFAGDEFCNSVAIRSYDGKIMLGGQSNGGGATFTAIARLLGDTPPASSAVASSAAQS